MPNKADRIDSQRLQQIKVLSELSDSDLCELAGSAVLFQLKKKEVLSATETIGKHCFLLSGHIELRQADNAMQSFDAESERAGEPIFHLRTPGLEVVCGTPVEIICVDVELLTGLLDSQGHRVGAKSVKSGERVAEIPLSDEEDHLLRQIHHHFHSREVELPALPEIATRINRMVADENATLDSIAVVLKSDPSICARIIALANSVIYAQGRPVGDIESAVLRTGLDAVRSVVMSVVLNNLYNSRSPLLKRYMQAFYEHSLLIGTIAHAVARRIDGFRPEHALLAGLLHDIGVVPVLLMAEKHEEMQRNRNLLESAIENLHGFVGGLLLQQWGFEEDLIVAAEEADDWFRDPGPDPDYCDIILLAQLHTGLLRSQRKGMPRVHEVPAFARLGLDKLGPDAGIAILNEAQQAVSEVAGLLR